METREQEEARRREEWIRNAVAASKAKGPLSPESIRDIRIALRFDEPLSQVLANPTVHAERESFTYFMRNSSGNIKIGKSDNPEERRRGLSRSAGEDIELLGFIPGGYGLEARLHRRFSHLRIVGEWFSPAPELLEYLEQVI